MNDRSTRPIAAPSQKNLHLLPLALAAALGSGCASGTVGSAFEEEASSETREDCPATQTSPVRFLALNYSDLHLRRPLRSSFLQGLVGEPDPASLVLVFTSFPVTCEAPLIPQSRSGACGGSAAEIAMLIPPPLFREGPIDLEDPSVYVERAQRDAGSWWSSNDYGTGGGALSLLVSAPHGTAADLTQTGDPFDFSGIYTAPRCPSAADEDAAAPGLGEPVP